VTNLFWCICWCELINCTKMHGEYNVIIQRLSQHLQINKEQIFVTLRRAFCMAILREVSNKGI
jgi:hypothetical protein